jgi:hypothetical protein
LNDPVKMVYRSTIQGTIQRARRIKLDKEKGRTPSSYFNENINVSKLIEENIGNGELYFVSNESIYLFEYVQLDHEIGMVYNTEKGTYQSVSRIVISYSKNGTHAYPVKDW